jgi:hypothetical protein
MFSSVGEGVSGANPSWNRGIELGTSNAVYVEDNEIVQTWYDWPNNMIADCENGGRAVVRHNTFTNMYIGGHDASSTPRSCLSYEAYDNTIYLKDVDGWSADARFNLRGGTHIIYNNEVIETKNGQPSAYGMWTDGPIWLRNYRSCAGWGAIFPWEDACDSRQVKICVGNRRSTWGANGGTYCNTDTDCTGESAGSGACQNIDANKDGSGYPCRDQIGITSDGTSQFVPFPSLFWNNRYQGSYSAPIVPQDGNNANHIRENRDYCHHQTTMPASCGGVATNYAPFVYPHPLRTGGSCTPSCAGRQCGPDGCGGSCGSCPGGQTCNSQGQCVAGSCTDTCASLGKQCGIWDICGISQSCGTCNTGTCVNGICQSQPSNFEVEAESGQLANPMQVYSDSQASGGQYVASSSDETGRVSFTFSVPAGQYYLQALVYCLDTGSDSFYVGSEAEAALGDDYYTWSALRGTGYVWDDVHRLGSSSWSAGPEFDPMVFDLSAGSHQFSFYGREAGARLDKVRLVQVGGQGAVHEADTDSDGCVEQDKLFTYISKWKSGQVTLANLMEAIGLWKNGC